MRVVVLVPRRSDGGRRDSLWEFTQSWLTKHHPDFEIFTGNSPDGPFNRGAAINEAARRAGDWDIAIVHDGDNFVQPARLREAVALAHSTQITHVGHRTYQYLDQPSSDEILANPDGPWWPEPRIDDANPRVDRQGYNRYVLHKHVSGVVVVPRAVWTATNGFVELTGWGSEDSFFLTLCNALGGGVEWITGSCFHLFHEHAPQDTTRIIRTRNRDLMLKGKMLEHRNDIVGLKAYLASLGHPVP